MWWLLLLLLWLGISLVPYGMFLVAWYRESRLAPIWKGQSKAFMPGDFGLSLAAAVGVVIVISHGLPEWVIAWWWQWLLFSVLAVAFVVFVGRHVLYKPNDYFAEAWQSPSKRYHDGVMYCIFPALAFIFVVPAYLQPWIGEGVAMRIIGILGVTLWACGLWWDATHDEVPNPNQHPREWKPREREQKRTGR